MFFTLTFLYVVKWSLLLRHSQQQQFIVLVVFAAMKNLRKLNLNSTHLSALTFEGIKVGNS